MSQAVCKKKGKFQYHKIQHGKIKVLYPAVFFPLVHPKYPPPEFSEYFRSRKQDFFFSFRVIIAVFVSSRVLLLKCQEHFFSTCWQRFQGVLWILYNGSKGDLHPGSFAHLTFHMDLGVMDHGSVLDDG